MIKLPYLYYRITREYLCVLLVAINTVFVFFSVDNPLGQLAKQVEDLIKGANTPMGRASLLCALFICIASHDLASQCLNGSEPECTCATAPVLCTIDELDGYMYSMTNYQHPQDAPSPLCPPPEGNNTVPNNPTWFAFIAWCTSLTLDVHISNCQAFQGGVLGVQIAIYSNCNPYTNVACDANSSDCGDNLRTISMNNLIIGDIYYFMIDGCLGSYCDVLIDVVGVCGEEMIDEWTEPIEGPTEICIGDSETFFAEDLDGATDFHWYIDGVLVDEGPDMNSFNYTWNSTGTFEICVDASNDPCIPESDPPDPNCITVEVFAAYAGMIDATPTPVCPNDVVNITATDFITGNGYQHYIVIADESGIIVSVVQGGTTTYTYDECAMFTAYSYSFHESGDNSPPQVGDPVSTIACNDGCCDQDSAPFEFIDMEDPVLLSPPGNLNLTCYDQLPLMTDLAWTDNCDGSGMVAGTETGTADLCDGGSLTREWTYTDQCGNEALHMQTITIDPVPLPVYNNLPPDMTVDCNNIPASGDQLTISNNATGQCAINAAVNPVQNGTIDVCGGSFNYTWEYTDFCDRTVTHVQNITITPIPPPSFDPVGQDVTVQCDGIPVANDLAYSNGETGDCAINGVVSPVIEGSADVCGGQINYTWDFTDQCGRAISAQQRITVLPAPEATFTFLPADTTVMCIDVPTSFPALPYSNGMTGACEIAGSVAPVVTNNSNSCGGNITVQWSFTDPCNRTIQHTRTITVEPAPLATWINPPADTTIDCEMLPTQIPDLSYSNGLNGACGLSGSVPGTLVTMDVCAGIVVWQWDFSDPCGNTITHTRNITTTPPPPVVFASPPNDTTVECADVPLMIPGLSYDNGSSGECAFAGVVAGVQNGNYNNCGGQLVRTWEVTDPCGVVFTHTQTITVLPAPPPVFSAPPADVTVNCNAVPTLANLTYNNGLSGTCAITGSVAGVSTGSYNACGGSLTYTWNLQDACGNTANHVQNITVLPAPPPAFVNPPTDVTLNCEEVEQLPLSLSYSNGQGGLCAITGSVNATVNGTYDFCGGALTYVWAFTDVCGTSINHVQQVAILPAADPVWIDPPADEVLGCNDEYLPPDDLFYTNNLAGECTIEGSAGPVVSFADNVYTHIWSYNHPCSGDMITYEQTVTIVPIPEIDLEPSEVVICDGDMFDLSAVLVNEVNGQQVTVTIHSDFPPDGSNEISNPVVTPYDGQEFIFLATNVFDCTDEAFFTIYVDPLPNAGDDGEQAICTTEGAIDFTDYLSFDADPGGYWIDVDGAGVDVDNPTNVSFSFVDPGTYHFQYVVAINDCPADTSVLTIILSGAPDFTIDTVFCTDGNTAYTVVILGSNLGLTVSAGSIVTIPGGFEVQGIPIDEQLTFDIWDLDIFCVSTFQVNAPNCDCPTVPAPVSLGNVTICNGEPIPALEISVSPGTIAHWYSAASGGTLLASNTTTYVPMVSGPGSYTFYVEAESEEFPGCVSNTRTPVTLTIQALPVVNNLSLEFCDTTETGVLTIDLNPYRDQISGNLSNTFSFHESMADAMTGTNPLSMPVSIGLGVNVYYARVVNINGCAGIAEVQVELIGLPPFTLQTQPVSCLGGADGVLTINGLPPGFYTVWFDSISWSSQYEFEGLEAGEYPVGVIDVVSGCFRWDTATVGIGADVVIGAPVITCNDNGTDTDPTDDFYSIEFNVTTTGGSMQFELFAGGASQGLFNYGEQITINAPATGLPFELVAVDIGPGCTDTLLTAALNTCSSNCEITIDQLIQVCSDNGTPLDPSDDFYTVTISASAVNGSTQYSVLIDGLPSYVFTYGMSEVFMLSAGQPVPAVQLQDVGDPQCFLNLNLQPLTPCSNQCDIPQPDVQYTCDDNGTPEDAGDDFYTIVFVASITNPGNSGMAVVLVDGNVVATVALDDEVTLSLPADGMTHVLQVQDQDDPGCQVSWNSILLTPCSTQCVISVSGQAVDCDDNGTSMDPTDDSYSISWTASAIFGSASGTYQIQIDGSPAGTGTYDEQQMLSLPADGSSHQVTLIDGDDGTCVFVIDIPALVPCSDVCAVNVNVGQVYCDNNGTNQTDSDDAYFIVFEVDGVNVSSGQWILEGTAISGPFGVTDTLGPYLITAGMQELIFAALGSNCTDTISVVPPAPCSSCEQSIDAGPDMTLDCGTPTVTLNVVSSEPGIATWKDPSGGTTVSASLDVSLAGEYTVTVLFDDGCEFSDTVTVIADPTLPAIWGGPDMQLNCEIGGVQLQSNVLVGGNNITYEWTDAGGSIIGTDANLFVTQPGTYYIRIYDQDVACWSGRDAVIVVDISNNPSAVIYANPGEILSCIIQSILLSTDEEDNVRYTWIAFGDQLIAPTFQISQGGTVILVAFDTISLCQSIDSIGVTALEEYPVINIEPPLSITCDRSSVLLDASSSLPASGVYTWLSFAGDTLGMGATFEVSSGGDYILHLIDPQNGCESYDTLTVIEDETIPEIVASPDILLPCDIETGSLSADLAVPIPGALYQWQTLGGQILGSSTGSMIQYSGAGIYIVEVTEPMTLCSDMDTIVVDQVTDTPSGLTLETSPSSCIAVSDGTIILGVVEGGTPPYSIFINGIETIDTIVDNLPSGSYIIEVEDAYGCVFDTTVFIDTGDEVMIFLEAVVNITQGDEYLLEAMVNIPPGEVQSVLWTPSTALSCDTCLTTLAQPDQSITYTVVVTDIYGCTGEATVTFRVADDSQVFIPNVITPGNHDGVNDRLTVYSNRPELHHVQSMQIFDRWGELVFQGEDFPPNDPAYGWDGTFKGKELNPGVFVYKVELISIIGTIEIISGDVTLVR